MWRRKTRAISASWTSARPPCWCSLSHLADWPPATPRYRNSVRTWGRPTVVSPTTREGAWRHCNARSSPLRPTRRWACWTNTAPRGANCAPTTWNTQSVSIKYRRAARRSVWEICRHLWNCLRHRRAPRHPAKSQLAQRSTANACSSPVAPTGSSSLASASRWKRSAARRHCSLFNQSHEGSHPGYLKLCVVITSPMDRNARRCCQRWAPFHAAPNQTRSSPAFCRPTRDSDTCFPFWLYLLLLLLFLL